MPYELKRSNGKYVFNLKGEGFEVLLIGNTYDRRHEALAAIDAVRALGTKEQCFELRQSASRHGFVLKSPKAEVLGRSEWFDNENAALRAMQITQRHCVTSDLKDWS